LLACFCITHASFTHTHVHASFFNVTANEGNVPDLKGDSKDSSLKLPTRVQFELNRISEVVKGASSTATVYKVRVCCSLVFRCSFVNFPPVEGSNPGEFFFFIVNFPPVEGSNPGEYFFFIVNFFC
jgi:hypothetical protein